ncbi:hypothetical protein ONZ43_g1224 [Nemania bipapillata]|uniref:Uncharacterized protein n=1 Tax=Nemania bipapillata TaxID=110536 RepID=A0ACC2J587_9PEZI|nr:hypothetical protein ONZ43_g1224 [Nemania bipapillata]
MEADRMQDLILWAERKGVQIYGITPARIPTRGVGIIATRELETGQQIMKIPATAIHSLHSIPPNISAQLPPDIPLHGLLAAELALKTPSTDAPWIRVLPTHADFATSVPFMWPEELHKHLPIVAYRILERQQDKFQREWHSVSRAFPHLDRSEYMYYWFIINTRTFFYESPEMEQYNWEDKLCLLPAADSFNHATDGYRKYQVGEELFISYGEHSNDFLLVEYGFTAPENPFDEIGLDEVIMPKLGRAQQDALAQQGLLGDFTFHAYTGPCIRTRAAITQIQKQKRQSFGNLVNFELGKRHTATFSFKDGPR